MVALKQAVKGGNDLAAALATPLPNGMAEAVERCNTARQKVNAIRVASAKFHAPDPSLSEAVISAEKRLREIEAEQDVAAQIGEDGPTTADIAAAAKALDDAKRAVGDNKMRLAAYDRLQQQAEDVFFTAQKDAHELYQQWAAPVREAAEQQMDVAMKMAADAQHAFCSADFNTTWQTLNFPKLDTLDYRRFDVQPDIVIPPASIEAREALRRL